MEKIDLNFFTLSQSQKLITVFEIFRLKDNRFKYLKNFSLILEREREWETLI